MSNSAYRAQLPEIQLSAIAALLSAVLVLTFALRHHQDLTHALQFAGIAHTAVVGAVLYRKAEARPLAVWLATARILALTAAARRPFTSRQEVWA
ncbi:hypothetical protein [Kitasatospora sp. KL5]|uniref:hypothetical protein n=1 Tax=Kitasatospora sp. KL5 TaxID=3425125 RepID=UPI003D6DD160